MAKKTLKLNLSNGESVVSSPFEMATKDSPIDYIASAFTSELFTGAIIKPVEKLPEVGKTYTFLCAQNPVDDWESLEIGKIIRAKVTDVIEPATSFPETYACEIQTSEASVIANFIPPQEKKYVHLLTVTDALEPPATFSFSIIDNNSSTITASNFNNRMKAITGTGFFGSFAVSGYTDSELDSTKCPIVNLTISVVGTSSVTTTMIIKYIKGTSIVSKTVNTSVGIQDHVYPL